jgi:hypothetical protein
MLLESRIGFSRQKPHIFWHASFPTAQRDSWLLPWNENPRMLGTYARVAKGE